MAVRNNRSVLDVVTNFDLTFCQVWFDGANVYASHPEHIKNKSGVLQNDYCKILFHGNRFLRKRLNKYKQKKYNIAFDKGFLETLSLDNLYPLPNDTNLCDRQYCGPQHQLRWFNRIAMRWFLNMRDSIDNKHKQILVIPLRSNINNDQIKLLDKGENEHALLQRYNPKHMGIRDANEYRNGPFSGLLPMSNYIPEKDDGYDSEDYDNDVKLKELAVKNFTTYNEELADLPVSPDLIYMRGLTSLFFNTYHSERHNYSLAELSQHRQNENVKMLFDFLRSKCLHSGDDYLGGEGELFHIHEHPAEAAITAESLESYLEGTMTGDEYDVKCYWAPEPVARGGPPNPKNCQHKLTLDMIKVIVSPEFYERYEAPRPKKEGLDQNVGLYESVFRNVKSHDPQYGDIYHSTMCPYCLKYEERSEGCAYMTHENPKGLGQKYTPFCKDERDTGLLIKYRNKARELEGYDVHIEFCVECGRPCAGHKHFNLEGTAFIENRSVPDPQNPGHMMTDYGNCSGGGRVEMIARMLAVRDIYRKSKIRDDGKERKLAAVAAEKAPLDTEYMRRAQAILDKAPLERVFNKPVPSTKKYNSPLYVNVNDDETEGVWNNTDVPAVEAVEAVEEIVHFVPANSEQKHWNGQNVDYINHLLDEDVPNMPVDTFNTLTESVHISGYVYQMLNDEELTTIDLNLVHVLNVIYIYTTDADVKETIRRKLYAAYRMGGQRVKTAVDPDYLYLFDRPPQGGKRKTKTFKRRKGLRVKRNRITRKK